MAFSLSDLLNPAPVSGAATPTSMPGQVAETEVETGAEAEAGLDSANAPSTYGSFAPELFANNASSDVDADNETTVVVANASLAAMAADTAATALELSDAAFAPDDDPITAALLREREPEQELEPDGSEEQLGSQYPIEGLETDSVTVTGQHTYGNYHDDHDDHDDHDHDHGDSHSYQHSACNGSPPKEKKYKKRTDLIKDLPGRSTVHSSKNEGQHTDRRYLCYICNKLFTRRRSVRDHINKIHNIKTWEPQRSLEIIVDPGTGEPVEPLEDIIARGPPASPTLEKSAAKRDHVGVAVAETIEGGDQGRVTTAKSEAKAEPDWFLAPVSRPSPVAKSEREDSVEQQAESPSSSAMARSTAGKKRAASASKKGIARPSHRSTPSNKKAKGGHGDGLTDRSVPLRSPSATPAASSTTTRAPASKLKHQTNADSVVSSPSTSRGGTVDPPSPTPSASATPASSNDDGEIFCICRKGDNHTWMIACDGGCDEWYHGNCVNIREQDGDLIDKYICPRCTKIGLQTTWKRMCRRKGCRKPARVLEDPPSKYCSKECGRMFFVELIRRGDPNVVTTKNDQFVIDRPKPKKVKRKRICTTPREDEKPQHQQQVQQQQQQQQQQRKATPAVNATAAGAALSKLSLTYLTPEAATEIDGESRLATPAYSADECSEYETDSSADEDELPNRGGPLRAGEVRAILDACPTIEQWRNLGRKPDTPPKECDGDGDNAMNGDATGGGAAAALDASIEYDDFEKAKLEEMAGQRKALEEKLEMLEAREKWMELIKARSTSIVERVKKEDKKAKDPCGFDPRFAWSEHAFLKWYGEKGGKAKLAGDSVDIGAPDKDEALVFEHLQQQDPKTQKEQEDGQRDSKMTNGIVNGEEDTEDADADDDGDAAADDNDSDDEAKFIKRDGVCVRNRCPRHKNWAKAQLAEIRFEQDVVRRGLRRCESVERGVRERGVIRAWEESKG